MLNKLEEFAFGEIGLTPFDFYKMTYNEFENLRKGYENKLNRDREFLAYLTSWVVNSSGNFKKPIEVKDILPDSVSKTTEHTKATVMSEEEKNELRQIIRGRRVI